MDELNSFNWANLLIGSFDTPITSFEYAQSWIGAQAFPAPQPVSIGIYPSDLFVGGFFFPPLSGEHLVGTLTVDASNVFYKGYDQYEIMVNDEFDQGLSGVGLGDDSEGLVSRVVPEPATLMLLVVGGLALLRRKRERSSF